MVGAHWLVGNHHGNFVHNLLPCYWENLHFGHLFRGKILIAGYIMKIISTDPPRIRTTYVTHVDLQGIYSCLEILPGTKALIEFFNNSDAIFNFEHIAMHCGLSRVIQLF